MKRMYAPHTSGLPPPPPQNKNNTHNPRQIVRLTLEAVYVLAHFLAPVMPYSATNIFKKLGNPPKPIPELQASLVNLQTGACLFWGGG